VYRRSTVGYYILIKYAFFFKKYNLKNYPLSSIGFFHNIARNVYKYF